jgi:hypothetical protein
MPESREEALARAKKLGMDASQVVKSDRGGWFIAPSGVSAATAKKAYANCRQNGKGKGECSAVSHIVQKNHDAKHSK